MRQVTPAVRVVLLALCMVLLATLAQAQYRAGVQGVVQDAQGAVISGALITVTAQDTGLTQTATSDANGVYSVARLAPGLYTIRAEKSGFRKSELKDVSIAAETVTSLSITMEVGAAAETVTVNGGEIPTIDTESGKIAATISSVDIANLPSTGRDPYQLLRLAPGIFGDGAQGSGGGGQALPGQNQVGSNPQASIFMTENQPGIVAAGARNNGNSFQIDGIQVNSLTWGGSALITPNEESVSEVQVLANSYSAENGRGAGAQVLVVSKGGTNTLHGSLFAKRHAPGLNAFQPYAGPNLPPPTRDTNLFTQWGGSVGGPIIKNKFFAFFSYERQHTNALSISPGWFATPQFFQAVAAVHPDSIASIWATHPGVNVKYSAISPGNVNTCSNAGFTEGTDCVTVMNGGVPVGINLGSPLTSALGTPDPTYGAAGTPFGVGNGLDPNTPDLFNVSAAVPNDHLSEQYQGRADFNVTKKDLITFSMYWVPVNNTGLNGTNVPVNVWKSNRLNYSAAAVWNHTFGSTLINEFRTNVARWYFDELKSNPQNLLGYPADQLDNLANVNICSGCTAFGPPGPGVFYQTSYNFRDTVTKVSGSHLLRFGADTYKDQVADYAIWAGLPPTFHFHNLWDWANDAPYKENGEFDPRTGIPTGVKKYIRSNIVAFFAQDDYKLRPNFTLNLGLRWEYFGPIHEKYGNLGVVTLGTGANTLTGLTLKTKVNAYNASHANFGPQIGFAWSPKSAFGHEFQRNFVLRGGFGISYTRPQEAITLNGRLNLPVTANFGNLLAQPAGGGPSQIVYGTSSPLTNPFGYAPNPNAKLDFTGSTNGLPTCAPATCAAVSLTAFDHNLATPRVLKYSVTGQYEIAGHWVASAGYQGSRSDNFFRQVNNVNWLYPNNQNPAVAGVDLYTNDAYGNYNALNLELQRRVSTFSFDTQYTYSLCKDTGSQDYATYVYPFKVSAAYGPCDYDATHSLKMFGAWTPRFFHGNGLTSKLLDGWTISGIFTYHGGFPWTPVLGAQDNGGFNYTVGGNSCSMLYSGSGLCWAGLNSYLGKAGHDYGNKTFEQNYGNFPLLAGATSNGANAYFSLPTFDAIGMPSLPGVSRNSFRGPRYRSFDLTLGKSFGLPTTRVLGEAAKVDIHAYFYNLFNNLNLLPLQPSAWQGTTNIGSGVVVDPATGAVTSFTPNPQFGRSTGALAGRVIELQARFSF